MLIRTRLTLIGSLPLLVFLLLIGWTAATQHQFDALMKEAGIVEKLEEDLFSLVVLAHDMEENRSSRPREQWPIQMRELESQLPVFQKICSSAGKIELAENFLAHIKDSQRDFKELAQWSAEHQDAPLNTAQQRYLDSLSKRLQTGLQSAIPIANKISAISKENALAFAERRTSIMITSLLLLAGAILLILWPMMRGITRSIEHLKTNMGKVALGNLDLRASVAGKDEFAELSQRFNEMTSRLAEVTVARERLSAEVIERKQAEDLLRATTDSLNEAQRIAHIGSWTLDLLSGRLSWSDEVFRLFEIDKSRFGATYEAFLNAIHAEDREMVNRAYSESLTNQTPYEIRHRLLMSDGRIKWVQERCVTDFDSAGKPLKSRGTVQDVTEYKLAEEAIENLAYYDPLTRLPNRRLLIDRLRQALALSTRTGQQGALVMIDLDNFKNINDTEGHAVGDQLLIDVAKRLQDCIREGDSVARLGGDEFVALIEGMDADEQAAAAQAETIGEKLLATLGQAYTINDRNYHSTASIGITLFRGPIRTAEEMLKRAEVALYQAKADGRNVLSFFDPAMQAAVNTRITLENDLRRAISLQEEFQLYYQAQVDSSGRFTGAEALLRWISPARGMVSPLEFIPLAEETGMILPLGHWVIATACQQLADWATQPEFAPLTLAVNVSTKQFMLSTFVDEVLTLVDYFGINPARLKLEITESLMMENVEEIIDKMAILKARGISFSMDDFGTGYSSLSNLKRLPLYQLKIDKSFVRDVLIDPNDAAIARMIITLAQTMNLAVIAEGVETEAQRDFLKSNGCHAYQGYLFNKPVPIRQFEALLQKGCAFVDSSSISNT